METTGQAIRAIRNKIGISQQAFSTRIGSTLMTVSRWERDVLTPKAMTLAQLARLAHELKLPEAAAVLNRECGAMFRVFGHDLLRRVSEYLAGLPAELGPLARNLGEDQKKVLARALERSEEHRAVLEQLMAMTPHVGPKSGRAEQA